MSVVYDGCVAVRRVQSLESSRDWLQRAQNRKDYLETNMRKQRTHRLITRGATLESIIPEVKDMSERAFYDAVETYFSTGTHRKEFCNQIAFSNAVKEHADRVITDRAKKKDTEKGIPNEKGGNAGESSVAWEGGA